MAQLRTLIHEVDPKVIEDWKWMGTPVWSHEGMLAHGNVFKKKVKLTIHHGAQLPDPKKLFNAGLSANKSPGDRLFRGRQDRRDCAEDLAARGDGLQFESLGTKETKARETFSQKRPIAREGAPGRSAEVGESSPMTFGSLGMAVCETWESPKRHLTNWAGRLESLLVSEVILQDSDMTSP